MRIDQTQSRNSRSEFIRSKNECGIELQMSTMLKFKYYGRRLMSRKFKCDTLRIHAFCQFCRSENDIAISLDGCYLRNELIRQYLLRVAKFGTPQLCSKYDPKEKGGPMNESTIKIRLMQADDFDAVVGPD